MALQGFRRVENGRAYVQESTGTRFTRRQYDKVNQASRGEGPKENKAIREGVAASRARAEKTRKEAEAAGLELTIREAQKLNKKREAKAVKETTKHVKKEQKQPQKPSYQPHKVHRFVSRNGKWDISSVGKYVESVEEAEEYEPYRPQAVDVVRLVDGLLDSQTILLIVNGVLGYSAEQADGVRTTTVKTRAKDIRRYASMGMGPEQMLQAISTEVAAVIVTYWSRASVRVVRAHG